MNGLQVLDDARRQGLRLSINGDMLHVEPVPPPVLIEKLKAAKPVIMARLRLETLATEACTGLVGYINASALLDALSPEDMVEVQAMDDPLPFLRSMAVACVWTAFRQDGIAPPAWTSPAYCDQCGPVYLWRSTRCKSCPWCWNRLHGVKIPRPLS